MANPRATRAYTHPALERRFRIIERQLGVGVVSGASTGGGTAPAESQFIGYFTLFDDLPTAAASLVGKWAYVKEPNKPSAEYMCHENSGLVPGMDQYVWVKRSGGFS